MKKLMVSLLLTGVLISSGCFNSDTETVPVPNITIKPSLSMSDKAEEPFVVDSTQSVTLEFGSPLDLNTVSGEVKLYRVKAAGEALEEPAAITFDKNFPAVLNIARKDGAKFTAGEEYKISVTSKVRTADGLSIGTDFNGYFAVNYPSVLDGAGIAELNGERSQIAVISDIHLGADISYSQFDRNYNGNGSALVDFLNKIRQAPNVKELVIAGDLIDESFVPASVDTFNGKTEAEFVDTVAALNKTVIEAFNGIITDGKIKVTYVPGNHDMLVTSADIQRIFPGISQARDAKGLGTYSPADRSYIAIEHGHRYGFYNSPDPISNRSITKTDSILPPGYFIGRIAATSIIENRPPAGYKIPAVTENMLGESQYLYFLYWKTLSPVISYYSVKEGYNDRIIKTNIDGYTADYAISDMIPYQTTANGPIDTVLYKGIQDNWDQRQTANQVAVKSTVREAIVNLTAGSYIDSVADVQYFKNAASKKRIAVFGHTHEARVISYTNAGLQKTIYANSGTWTDTNPYATMTFVMITPGKSSGSAPCFVNIYKYSKQGTITRISNPQAITDIE